MRRGLATFVLVAALVGSLLLVATMGESFSDGVAGSSGAIAAHLRDCPGGGFCKVRPAYCGGCHGSYEEMWTQEEGSTDPPPQTRISSKVTFSLNDDPKAGSVNGLWEYDPGEIFRIGIRIDESVRPRGVYNAAGFDLNASAGWLELWDPNDDTVRITGGLYQHQGTKNTSYWAGSDRYGAALVDETQWAGEATHTAKGAEQRTWTVKWVAPFSEPPHGAALVMAVLIPNDDGIDTCTRQNCNGSQPHKPQSEWDWFAFTPIPRRILCERGQYESFGECQDAVIDYILPPSPPAATDCPPEDPRCPTETTGDDAGRGTPMVGAAAFLVVVAAAGHWLRRRRR